MYFTGKLYFYQQQRASEINMKIKQGWLIIFFVLTSEILFGQKILEKRRSLFLEIGGSGGLGSLNYENVFLRKPIIDLSWRAGFSLAPIDRNNGTGIVLPVMINAQFGKNAHKLEAGLGQGITITTKGQFFFLATAAVGYRWQPEDKRVYFRVMYTPLISWIVDFQVQHWGGFSIGYLLNRRSK